MNKPTYLLCQLRDALDAPTHDLLGHESGSQRTPLPTSADQAVWRPLLSAPTNPAIFLLRNRNASMYGDFNSAAAIPPGKGKRPPLQVGLIRRHDRIGERTDIIDENLHAIANLHRANATRRARDDDVARQ